MGKVKNQHYVPRSYLKYFSNKKGQIWVFDKEVDKVFRSNITNIASQRYFYDIPFDEVFKVISDKEMELLNKELLKFGYDIKEDGHISIEQGIEDFFSTEVESPYKSMLDNIRSRYVLRPSPLFSEAITLEERYPLSLLIAYQIVRSKEFRESLLETKEGAMLGLAETLAKMYDENYKYGTISIKKKHEFPSIEHAQIILGDFPLKLAKSLEGHCWVVGVNNTDIPFYTSDNPVIKAAHKRHPIISYEGYGSEGIEIALPISPRHILIIYERSFHKDFLEFENLFIPIIDVQNVIYYNSLQVYQSNRQIYCHDKKFHLLDKMKSNLGSLKRKPKKIIVNGREF